MKTKISLFILLLFFGLSLSLESLSANNIRVYDPANINDVSKVEYPKLLSRSDDPNIPDYFYAIQFNLTWDNSWKSSNPRNWDAAWIFVKYNLGGTGWNHVYLADTILGNPKHGIAADGFATGASTGQGSASFAPIDYIITPGYSYVSNLGKNVPVGVFLYRAKNGYGTVQFEKLRLFWNYRDQGLASDDPITVQVFAVEMVYVPEGEFRLGTGGTENLAFRNSYVTTLNPGIQGEPFVMRTEDSLCIVPYPATAGPIPAIDSSYLSYKDYTAPLASIQAGTAARIRIGKNFPKGVNPYYVMKYEITQGAYVGYLNTLNIQQQGARTKRSSLLASDKGGNLGRYDKKTYRNGVTLFDLSGAATFVCNLSGLGTTLEDVNQSDDGENIAMGYLSIMDVLSYLAWAGLRPLTEFEFEKACRGNQLSVKDEYPWGNTTINPCMKPDNDGGVRRPGYDNEKPISRTADQMTNYNGRFYNNTDNLAPVRVGSFADSATSRAEAGASYWGIMELGGNITEYYVIATKETATLLFTGLHGYGSIDPITANILSDLSWPENSSEGYLWRGGGCGVGGGLSTNVPYLNQGQYHVRVSDRSYAGTMGSGIGNTSDGGGYPYGGRGGRSAK